MEPLFNRPLAILGMACRLPGAENLSEYWKLLVEGRSAIVQVPDALLQKELYYDSRRGQRGKTYINQGGLIDYPAFDQTRCNYPIRLMGRVEVGHLMMCQVAAAACRQGGLDPFAMPYRNTGVYVGNNQAGDIAADLAYSVIVEEAAQYLGDLGIFREMTGEQAESVITEVVDKVRSELPRYGHNGFPTVGPQVTANAVTETFRLNGPSMVVDAACSSSLMALALAARDLELGNTEMAIVGGASFFKTDSLIIFSAAQSGSDSGSCPFSDRANGFISAEGYVAIVVKTLDRALADGDRIQCVISGIGVSTDGRGKSLWAPRKEGQVKAIQRAYSGAADMSRISYVEAHATSTALGDQIELEAMNEAFRAKLPPGKKIPIGGVKANIGHALEAAGLAGLLKAVLVLKNETVPQQIQCQPLNTKIDWGSSPFYVPQKNSALPKRSDGHLRQSAVNAFGIGGLNVHVVLEEYLSEAPAQRRISAADTRHASVPEPIALVGAGCLFCGARTLEAYADLIFSQRDPKCDVPQDRWTERTGYRPGEPGSWSAPVKRGGFITDFEYDWRRHRIAPKQLATADPLQFMILDSFDAALADSGYDEKPFDKENTGVIVGASFDTDFATQLCMGFRLPHFQRELKRVLQRRGLQDDARCQELMDAFADKVLQHMPALLDETGSFTPSALASRIAKTYDLMGGAGTIETGNTVGLAAILQAVNALRTGACNVMACAVGARMMGLATFVKMGLAGNLPAGEAKTTLDEDCDGQLPGEGAGVLIFKRLSDAQRDGDSIRCIIHGIGTGFSADPTVAFTEAIQRAMKQTDASLGDVQLVELSAAAPKAAGQEIQAIEKTYCLRTRTAPLLLSEASTQVGDTLGASGLASFLKANFELQQLTVPPQFGLQKRRTELGGEQQKLAAAQRAVRLRCNSDQDPVLAGISSWDVCGSAYHMIIQRGNRVPIESGQTQAESAIQVATKESPTPAADAIQTTPVVIPLRDNSTWRIVRFGATSSAALAETISVASRQAEHLYRQSATVSGFDSTESHRLAIVASNPQDLAGKLDFAAKYCPSDPKGLLARKCIYVGEALSSPGEVAFLFSGQGSQYTGMLRSLIEGFQPATEAMQQIDQELERLDYPSWADLAWEDSETLGVDVFRTQLSLLCADTILFRSLAALEVRPNRVAGHSYGEYPALAASGAWTFSEAAEATKGRCDSIVACRNLVGGMLFTNADAGTADRLCRQAEGEVYVANLNAPNQTILGGTAVAMENVQQLLVAEGFTAKLMQINRPYHTVLMQAVKLPLAQALQSVHTVAPTLPILSSVTNQYVTDSNELRNNLVAQMTRPVRYIDLILKLLNDGVTAFVECGPRNVLTGLNEKNLDGQDALRIASDQPKRDGLCQLLCVRAGLEVRGHLDKNNQQTSTAASVQGNGVASETKLEFGRKYCDSIRMLLRRQADAAVPITDTITLSQVALDEIRSIACGAGVLTSALTALAVRRYVQGDGGLSVENQLRKMIESSSASPVAKVADRPSRARPVAATAAPVVFSGVDPTRFRTISAEQFDKLSRNVGGVAPIDFADRKYCRFTMRVMEQPVDKVDWSRLKFHGRVLLVGDNELACELARQITSHGGTPVQLPLADDFDATRLRLEQLWNEGPLPHLYLLTAHDDNAATDTSENLWNYRRERGIMLPFLVAQRWFQLVSQAKLTEKASICAATLLGGDFGISGQHQSVESGALTGLVKSMDLEVGIATGFAFRSKIVDFSGTESAENRARSVLAEIAIDDQYEVEVGYVGSRRFLVRPTAHVIDQTEPIENRPQGTWVVTGGGRGITAYIALETARRYGLKLHLLGSSPAPQVDPEWRFLDDAGCQTLKKRIYKTAQSQGQVPAHEWRRVEKMLELDKTLQDMSAAGVKAVYHVCDVSDRRAIAATLDAIRREDGPIDGIIHGAGIEVSCRLEKKDPAIVAKTLAVKSDAAAALIDLTQNDPIRHFIGFGSVAGRMGSVGQTDYSMANELLAKLLGWYQTRRPDCRVTCFHWGPWGEIGLTTKPEMRDNEILSKMTLLPPPEGLGYFLGEFADPEPTTETLLIDWEHYKLYYPDQAENNLGSPTPAISSTPDVSSQVASVPSVKRSEQPHDATDRKIRRMVLRWVDDSTAYASSSSRTAQAEISGTAMIFGKNRDADALAELLQSRGVSVSQVPSTEDPNEALVALDASWQQGPISHLFILTGRDLQAAQIDSREDWIHRKREGFETPFHLLRHWLRKITEADMLGNSAVVAVTALGGDCGFASGSDAIEGAGVAGLLKAIHLEHGGTSRDGLKVKIIDAPSEEDAGILATAVISELAIEGVDIEVAYVDGKRRLPRLVNEKAEAHPRRQLKQNSTWVITGGARGISAEVAKTLGKRFGMKLHLLGTRPLPQFDEAVRYLTDEQLVPYKRQVVRQALKEGKSPDHVWGPVRKDYEIDRNLRAMQADGVQVTYHQCDVTVPEQLQRTFDEIRRLSGPINGIIHGAGIDGNPATVRDLLDSQFEISAKLMSIKCDAAMEMLRLTANDPLQYFVGFGSISGRFGSASASSYCSGNDMLCKIIGRMRKKRPECHAVGFHWHAWGEVGMMTRPVSLGSIKILKMQLMPPSEGIEHLIRELEIGTPESEIVITDSQYYALFYSKDMLVDAASTLPPDLPGATGLGARNVTFPLIRNIQRQSDNDPVAVGQCTFRPATDPFLIDHCFQRRPLLPAVIALESFAEMAQSYDPSKRVVAIHNLQLHDGLRFRENASRTVNVQAERSEDMVACRLEADFRNRKGVLVQSNRLHASAIVELTDQGGILEFDNCVRPQVQWHPVQYPPSTGMMYHGPTFQLLTQCAFPETGEVWGEAVAGEIDTLCGDRPTSGWQTQPALLDAGLYLCGIAVWLNENGALGLPKSMDCLRLGRLPKAGEKCLVRLRPLESPESERIFDIACFGEDQSVLFMIDGYHCRIVLNSLGKAVATPTKG